MNVKNRKCIRKLSFKTLMASRRRNLIAIAAIVLTTLLFTSLFTIALSINSSYETYQFRQIGGYCHGTFKDVTKEQAAAIAGHRNVRETGERRVIGICSDGVFAKVPAEISFMDANCTKWSYAQPSTGRMPESGREIAMDTAALQKLGITPRIGAEITLTYPVMDKNQEARFDQTDTFTLVGWWDIDNLMPVHYINISKEYAKEIEKKAVENGAEPFRTDLNVMMRSAINIRGQMEQVDTDLGYTWEEREAENSARIGVNWGYTASQAGSKMDPMTVVSIVSFIVLVVFTGYLIIYNIFQISVTSDIRFYGLLKTIGTTPRQIRRIIRQQALLLCLVGIPIGILCGYGIGAILVPVVMNTMTLGKSATTISTSPLIFGGSVLFSLVTVLISCAKPGRIAAKVSPVEAAKYTETVRTKKKKRTTRGAKIHQMAYANLGRNSKKTILVVVSLALSVTLLNELYVFIGGFDMEKYTSKQTCADFIVSSPEYFRFNPGLEEYISDQMIEEIKTNTNTQLAGCGYRKSSGGSAFAGMREDVLVRQYMQVTTKEIAEQAVSQLDERNGMRLHNITIEGLDKSLFEKLTIVDGDISPMFDSESKAIAISVEVDDYGNVMNIEDYPKIGEKLTITYAEDSYFIDSRTGEKATADTPEEYTKEYIENGKDVEYTVYALVVIPRSMSFRSHYLGNYEVVLPVEKLRADSGHKVTPLFYLFDTPDEASETAAEEYLSELTAGDLSPLMYESKATLRAEFTQFKNMFVLLGGLLCVIIGLVGVLNFFNAIMTGIISRQREFAVLQSVGMTNRQLKSMLVYEGIFYALSAVVAALILALILGPLTGGIMNDIFWFYEYHFSITPVLVVVPIFVLMGWLIPAVLYGEAQKRSVVERLREAE